MKSFGIGIPTLNRKDLLSPALMYYCIDMPEHEKYILDNGQQNLTDLSLFIFYDNIKVYENTKNIGVAASWNFLCKKIFEKHEYALILNDDIYLGKKDWEIENLISSFQADFYLNEFGSAIIIPKKTFEEVGNFDEQFFPAYYEDTDYEYRLKLLGKSVMKIPFLNPLVNRKSSTIEKDTSLIEYIDNNMQRYIQKWGGLPGKEMKNGVVFKLKQDDPNEPNYEDITLIAFSVSGKMIETGFSGTTEITSTPYNISLIYQTISFIGSSNQAIEKIKSGDCEPFDISKIQEYLDCERIIICNENEIIIDAKITRKS